MCRNITHLASQPIISTFFCHTWSFIWVLGTAQWESWDWRFGSGDHFFPFLPYHFLNKKVPFFLFGKLSMQYRNVERKLYSTLGFSSSHIHSHAITHTFVHKHTHMQSHTHTHTYNVQSHASFSEPSECELQTLDTSYIFEHFLRTI